MIGKFVFVFLAVCSLSQCYEARSVTSPFSLEDVVQSIEELVQKIKDALAQLPELIKTLPDKIKEIVNKLDIPKAVAEIKAQVEEIIKAAGIDFEAAAQCIAAQEKASENLVEEATNGVKNCMTEIESAEKDLEALVTKLSEDAENLIGDITTKANKCIKDNGLNIKKMIECLEGLIEPVTEDVNNFVKDIEQAIEDANKIIDGAINNLTDCVAKVGHDVQANETQIIGDFQKCIDDITNVTTNSSN